MSRQNLGYVRDSYRMKMACELYGFWGLGVNGFGLGVAYELLDQ